MLRSVWSMVLLLGGLLAVTGVVLAASKEHTISQKNKEFSKTDLTIKAGDNVVFKNDDEVVHNVYSKAQGNEFNIKTQKPGESSTITFENPGLVEVRCAIHPKMKLIIKVEK